MLKQKLSDSELCTRGWPNSIFAFGAENGNFLFFGILFFGRKKTGTLSVLFYVSTQNWSFGRKWYKNEGTK